MKGPDFERLKKIKEIDKTTLLQQQGAFSS